MRQSATIKLIMALLESSTYAHKNLYIKFPTLGNFVLQQTGIPLRRHTDEGEHEYWKSASGGR